MEWLWSNMYEDPVHNVIHRGLADAYVANPS